MRRRCDHGHVLILALVVLVLMLIASAALFNTISAGTTVIGNMGVKQAAIGAGDASLEAARRWLTNLSAAEVSRLAVNGQHWGRAGYFATWGPRPAEPADRSTWTDPLPLDPAVDIDWSAAFDVEGGRAGPSGHVVQFVVHRMCRVPGVRAAANDPITGQQCVMTEDAGSTRVAGKISYGGTDSVYYRVTTRVTGSKGATAYVQAMIR